METKITFVLFCLNLLIISTICAAIQPVQDKKDSNTTSCQNSQLRDDKDPLVNLGHISTQMLRTIVEAEDQQLDINQFATFITALSKGAAIMKYPEIYKEIQGTVQDENLNNLSKMVEEMKKNLRQTMDELDSTKTKMEEFSVMEERVAILEDELHNANNTINELKVLDAVDNFVGFTAFAKQDQSLSTGTIINFNKVLVNYGNAYNATTSVFRCPFKGIYMVSAHIEESSSSGFLADAEILIGDTQQLLGDHYIFRLHAHKDSDQHGNSGGSAIVECAEGNHIRFKSSDDGSVHGSEQRSFFSVHLLKKLIN